LLQIVHTQNEVYSLTTRDLLDYLGERKSAKAVGKAVGKAVV
jgi:hypothetical protein